MFWGLHFAIILLCAWLVLGGGLQLVTGWFGQAVDWTDPTRARILLVGGGVFRESAIALSWLDVCALGLYFFGSYLNSASEIQRKVWKKNPSHKGHCYTGGLFRYSMHMNYFGDVVLFTGWSLLTAAFWTLGLPALVLLMFMFIHIPPLDQYLAER